MQFPILLLIPVILIAGFFKLLSEDKAVKDQRAFAKAFLSRFTDYLQTINAGQNAPGEAYPWLVANVVKIQQDLGLFGIVQHRPPFQDFVASNYSVLMETLPRIMRGRALPEETTTCVEALTHYIEALDRDVAACAQEIRNPFIWIRTGMQSIVLIPFLALYWLGLISAPALAKIARHPLMKLISLCIVVVAILGTVFSIITGSDQYKVFVNNLIR